MQIVRILLFLLVVSLFFQPQVFGAIYKWVDENGTITFRDTPPPEGQKATRVTLPPDTAGIGEVSSSSSGSDRTVGRGVTSPRKRAEVELFVTSWCGYCKKAIAFFRGEGVSVRQYDVEKDSGARKRFEKLNPAGGVPVALVNGRTIKGFNPVMYKRALDGT